jgi:D-inositol-3-phosphate glycosyltransferase
LRVAVLTLHTSPEDQSGVGDSGGLNVFVRSLWKRLGNQGFEADIFTRWRGERSLVHELSREVRLLRLPVGPPRPIPKEELVGLLPELLLALMQAGREVVSSAPPYDLLHSHYWLSGWVGMRAAAHWRVPLVASFHTLGYVKNMVLPLGDRLEPEERTRVETEVMRVADGILAPTPSEARHMMDLYGANPDRIHIVPAGVDLKLFVPVPKERAKRALGVAGRRLLLFVGRLQPFKGPDLAIRTLAAALSAAPDVVQQTRLAVIGGTSGSSEAYGGDGPGFLRGLARRLGVVDRVDFVPAQPQARLAGFYAAADALLMPSRSEAFGLAALEAQACGTPVIASAQGGLRDVLVHGKTGFLVADQDAGAWADRVIALLRDDELSGQLGRAARQQAARFPWDATVRKVASIYSGLCSSAVA